MLVKNYMVTKVGEISAESGGFFESQHDCEIYFEHSGMHINILHSRKVVSRVNLGEFLNPKIQVKNIFTNSSLVNSKRIVRDFWISQ